MKLRPLSCLFAASENAPPFYLLQNTRTISALEKKVHDLRRLYDRIMQVGILEFLVCSWVQESKRDFPKPLVL